MANTYTQIHLHVWLPSKFAWQEGFGAFSYSAPQLSTVIAYIEQQEKHHARRSFLDEYRSFLKKFEGPFEDKYLFQELKEEQD